MARMAHDLCEGKRRATGWDLVQGQRQEQVGRLQVLTGHSLGGQSQDRRAGLERHSRLLTLNEEWTRWRAVTPVVLVVAVSFKGVADEVRSDGYEIDKEEPERQAPSDTQELRSLHSRHLFAQIPGISLVPFRASLIRARYRFAKRFRDMVCMSARLPKQPRPSGAREASRRLPGEVVWNGDPLGNAGSPACEAS